MLSKKLASVVIMSSVVYSSLMAGVDLTELNSIDSEIVSFQTKAQTELNVESSLDIAKTKIILGLKKTINELNTKLVELENSNNDLKNNKEDMIARIQKLSDDIKNLKDGKDLSKQQHEEQRVSLNNIMLEFQKIFNNSENDQNKQKQDLILRLLSELKDVNDFSFKREKSPDFTKTIEDFLVKITVPQEKKIILEDLFGKNPKTCSSESNIFRDRRSEIHVDGECYMIVPNKKAVRTLIKLQKMAENRSEYFTYKKCSNYNGGTDNVFHFSTKKKNKSNIGKILGGLGVGGVGVALTATAIPLLATGVLPLAALPLVPVGAALALAGGAYAGYKILNSAKNSELPESAKNAASAVAEKTSAATNGLRGAISNGLSSSADFLRPNIY